MKIDQFKKAAKRYANDVGIPLNEAQEKFVSYFGFRNFDAAIKILGGASVELKHAKPTVFCSGLSYPAFRLLCHLLFQRAVRNSPSDIGLWVQKGKVMFDAVIANIDAPLYYATLYEYLTFENVVGLYVSFSQKSSEGGVAFTERQLRLRRYFESLPGFRFSDYDVNGNEIETRPSFGGGRSKPDGLAKEQHMFRLDTARNTCFDVLRCIESDESSSELLDWLESSAASRRLPNAQQTLIFESMLLPFDSALVFD